MPPARLMRIARAYVCKAILLYHARVRLSTLRGEKEQKTQASVARSGQRMLIKSGYDSGDMAKCHGFGAHAGPVLCKRYIRPVRRSCANVRRPFCMHSGLCMRRRRRQNAHCVFRPRRYTDFPPAARCAKKSAKRSHALPVGRGAENVTSAPVCGCRKAKASA